MNGMYLVRHPAEEQESWANLVAILTVPKEILMRIGLLFPTNRWVHSWGARRLNLSINQDPEAGHNTGPFWSTSAINPSNSTCSFSCSGYIDPFLYRANLYALAGNQVTKVISDNSTPPGVMGFLYAATSDAATPRWR